MGLQSPYGAFCLRLEWPAVATKKKKKLQSPYGAFCLRPPGGYLRLSWRFRNELQSPYGPFCLRQHTPLIAVL